LIFHVIDATSTAWTFEVDNIQVGQKNVAVGAAIGNWNSYPVALTGGTLGTVDYARWRRVGANMEIEIHAIVSASTDTLRFDIPAGHSMVSDPNESVKGIANYHNISTGTTHEGFVEPTTSDNKLLIRTVNGAASWWGSTQPTSTWSVSTKISLQCSIPIAQWTSNVNMASDFTEYASNTAMGSANGADTTVYRGSDGSPMPVVTYSGLFYKDCVFARAKQAGDDVTLQFRDEQGGWQTKANEHWLVGSSGAGYMINNINNANGFIGYWLNDFTYRVYIAQYQTGTVNWSASLANCRWRVRKVSNGNMAEVPPVVRAEYNYTSTVLANTDIIYTTKDEDTHSAYNTTNGRFTAPVAGIYSISAVVALSATTSDHTLKLFKNGSFVKYFGQTRGVGVGYLYGYPTKTIHLLAGDYITIQCGAALAAGVSDAYRIEITRIGS